MPKIEVISPLLTFICIAADISPAAIYRLSKKLKKELELK